MKFSEFDPMKERTKYDLQRENSATTPDHYRCHKNECIEEMVYLFGIDAVIGFCRCNVHKYRYRKDKKNGQEDLDKADWYMTKLKELEQRRSTNNG